jgi:hypothetical protein
VIDSKGEDISIGDFVVTKRGEERFTVISNQDEFGDIKIKNSDFSLSVHPSNVTKKPFVLKLAQKEG